MGLKPDLPPFFVFSKLIQLPGVMGADPLQTDHIDNRHTPVAKGGPEFFRQEKVAGCEPGTACVIACVTYLFKVRHLNLVLKERQLND